MPAAKGAPEGVTPDEKPAADPAPVEDPMEVAEYIAGFDTVYLAVPLTAHPARPAIPGGDTTEPVPAQPATVYAWPDGMPQDGRWQPTRKQPNQAPDNAGPVTVEE